MSRKKRKKKEKPHFDADGWLVDMLHADVNE